MTLNPNFDQIGQNFVKFYYEKFDKKAERHLVAQFYVPQSLLTFEGQQVMGAEDIYRKLTEGFPMDDIARSLTKVDCQPTLDGGVLVFVLGQLKGQTEGDKVMGFSQVFILKPLNDSFVIAHDIFRLSLHDFCV
ncbi:nuclear transport factor 2-like [Pomacea canaliculata]|uniref:nuclear transport factor 2-like n=1 Tax=Pomacea canaliculata TaxID=400727 RepID=UPI000D7274D3|nr:nuclear transport factor 2-like [Pomacea canaliculata]